MKKKNLLKKRGAGILMPISSLPSPYGIGTLGKAAYDFVDSLVEAKQTYWQVLPVGPTSYGDSPYQSFSAFAGNPYFIDLDILIEEGFLSKSDVTGLNWGSDASNVDYAAIFNVRFDVLRKAYKGFLTKCKVRELEDFEDFKKKNKKWLDDYSLYMALKFKNGNREWLSWSEDLRFRKKKALKKAKEEVASDIDFWKFCQYEFFKQFMKLKNYANSKKIFIIGDIPLYVALDSADVWANPKLFDLDEERRPRHVAGVPPDIFSADGQRWGNPIYDWKKMEEDGFDWWGRRMKAMSALYDVIRIDHFIGIVNYWAVPAENETAIDGEWVKGPGSKLTDVIKKSVGKSKIIAEDLGVITPPVRNLINECKWPGMKILQFAFDSDSKGEYLPQNYKDCNWVVYGGTHDNNTNIGYLNGVSEKQLKKIKKFLGLDEEATVIKVNDEIIRLGYMSIANTVIYQVQDLLRLDESARINMPSTIGTNWRFRMVDEKLPKRVVKQLKSYVKLYNR